MMYGSLTFPPTALTTVPPIKSKPIKAIKNRRIPSFAKEFSLGFFFNVLDFLIFFFLR